MPTPNSAHWRCRYCGCEDIEAVAFVNMNTDKVVSWDGTADYWCPRCEEWYRVACVEDPCDSHPPGTANCQRRTIA